MTESIREEPAGHLKPLTQDSSWPVSVREGPANDLKLWNPSVKPDSVKPKIPVENFSGANAHS